MTTSSDEAARIVPLRRAARLAARRASCAETVPADCARARSTNSIVALRHRPSLADPDRQRRTMNRSSHPAIAATSTRPTMTSSTRAYPFVRRNTAAAANEIRSFPSTNAWFPARLCRSAATCSDSTRRSPTADGRVRSPEVPGRERRSAETLDQLAVRLEHLLDGEEQHLSSHRRALGSAREALEELGMVVEHFARSGSKGGPERRTREVLCGCGRQDGREGAAFPRGVRAKSLEDLGVHLRAELRVASGHEPVRGESVMTRQALSTFEGRPP